MRREDPPETGGRVLLEPGGSEQARERFSGMLDGRSEGEAA